MRIKCLLYLSCNSIVYSAVGYKFLGNCHLPTVKRQTTFEQKLQVLYQAREAYTKSLNILLFYSNCDQEILDGEIFTKSFLLYNNFTDYSVEGPCCFI